MDTEEYSNLNDENKAISSPLEAPTDIGLETAPEQSSEVPISLKLALIQTFATFQQYGLANSAECNQLGTTIGSSWSQGIGADPLESLAKLRYVEGEDFDLIIETLSFQIAQGMSPVPLKVPFLNRLIPPSSFYEKYPSVAKICELMMVPVSYNEDADVIGLTSINPCFSDALSSIIIDEMKLFTKVKPIINITRVSYSNWSKMYKKHFKKGGQN